MTRKSKKQCSETPEELEAALNDPDVIVKYNHDGSYYIEYKEPSPEPEPVPVKDHFDTMYRVYYGLIEHCRKQGLPFLDLGGFTEFNELLWDHVPDDFSELTE